MFWVSRRRRLPLTVALLIGLIALAIIVDHTHGPHPDPGSTYSGTIAPDTPVTFAVNRAGTRVQDFSFPDGLPGSCGRVHTGTGSAPITAQSGFLARVQIHGGSLLISGLFHSLGREDGAIAGACGLRTGYTTRSDTGELG